MNTLFQVLGLLLILAGLWVLTPPLAIGTVILTTGLALEYRKKRRGLS